MSYPNELKQWVGEVSTHLPNLSKSQAMVLALYSFGMVMTKTCGQTTITLFLSQWIGQAPSTLRQRLREWTYDPEAKSGTKRRAVDPSACFAPLLSWLLSYWTSQQVVLALDATYLGSRFMILAVSVVYKGGGIPVAWYVLPGEAKREWHPLWVHLLHHIQSALPIRYEVYVLTDRGLASKRLFQVIEQKGWYPIMRIRAQGKFRRPRAKTWRSLERFARPAMGVWCHEVIIFKGDPLRCTLLVYWDVEHNEPFLLLTCLPTDQVQHNVYNLRMWIEAGFKDLKRGGLRWEQTKMTDPRRAERLWLVMAVALLWLATVQATPTFLAWANDPLVAKVSWVTYGYLLTLLSMLQAHPVRRCAFSPYEQGIFVRQLKTYP
jgi:hypothetical protein